MIYILANIDKTDEIQLKIFKFLKNVLLTKPYTIIYCEKHIIESTIQNIDYQNDIVFWIPVVAYNNLHLVKGFTNSIVMLLNKTILIQKISLNNPINEQMAINHGFNICYVDEEFSDLTNNEWKLVITKTDYNISHESLHKLI